MLGVLLLRDGLYIVVYAFETMEDYQIHCNDLSLHIQVAKESKGPIAA